MTEGLGILLARQEGSNQAEWPYQGVYRVRAEADDPDSLIEGRGRRRTVIPIGYRVGGTSIAGRAVMRPSACRASAVAPLWCKESTAAGGVRPTHAGREQPWRSLESVEPA